MKNTILLLFIIIFQICKQEILPNKQRRILPGGIGEAFLFQVSDTWDSMKSLGDWRSRADYNEITFKYRTEDQQGEMNETIQYFVETYSKDMRNRCKMSIYNQLESQDQTDIDETLGIDYMLEICNEFSDYLTKNIRLSRKFFDLEYALLFFRIHLNQKTGYMQDEVDPEFYQHLQETNKDFFQMMIKDIREQMMDSSSEHFFNYQQLHSFYNNFWAKMIQNLSKLDNQLQMQKINETSIFSQVFRQKYNANKYSPYTSAHDHLKYLYGRRRNRQFRLTRFFCTIQLSFMIYFLFSKGSVMHTFNSSFQGGQSKTIKRIPNKEAEFYSWEQHAFHALEQMKEDYDVAESHH